MNRAISAALWCKLNSTRAVPKTCRVLYMLCLSFPGDDGWASLLGVWDPPLSLNSRCCVWCLVFGVRQAYSTVQTGAEHIQKSALLEAHYLVTTQADSHTQVVHHAAPASLSVGRRWANYDISTGQGATGESVSYATRGSTRSERVDVCT